MLIAFGDDLDMQWLEPELAREDAGDALDVLRKLAESRTPVTHERLLGSACFATARVASVGVGRRWQCGILASAALASVGG